MNIFAGNLSRQVTEQDLRELFESYGRVDSVNVIRDRIANISKGFGFIEMPNQTEAKAAIAGLSGKDMKGKRIVVNEARPRGQHREHSSSFPYRNHG